MTETNMFCLFRSLSVEHLVSLSQEFNNEVRMWYSSSPQKLLQCTGSSVPTGYFYGFCSMRSSFLQGKLVKAVVKFPDITLAVSRVKGELCQCTTGSSCSNQRALKSLRDRGGTQPTFKGIIASNLTPPKSPSSDDDEILDVTPDDVQKANAFRATLITKSATPRTSAPIQTRGNGHFAAGVAPHQKELLAHINMLNGHASQSRPRQPVVPVVQPPKQRKDLIPGVPPGSRQPHPVANVRPVPPSVVSNMRQKPNSVTLAEQQLQHQLQKARAEHQLQLQLKKNTFSRATPVVQPQPKQLLPVQPHFSPRGVYPVDRNAVQPATSARGNLASALAQMSDSVSPNRYAPSLPRRSALQLGDGTIRATLRGPGSRLPSIRSQISAPTGVQSVNMPVMQNLTSNNSTLAQMSMPGCSYSRPGPSTVQPCSVPNASQNFDLPIAGLGRKRGCKRRSIEDDDYAPGVVMETSSVMSSSTSLRPKRACTRVGRSVYFVDDEPTDKESGNGSKETDEVAEPVFEFLRYRNDAWKEYDLKKQTAKRKPTAEEIDLYDISVCKQCNEWVPKRERRNHALELHGEEKRYRCEDEDCDFQTMNYQKGQQHLKRRHNFETRIFDWKMDKSFRAHGNAMLRKCFPSDEPLPIRCSHRVINFTTAITGERKKPLELEEPSFQDVSGPWFAL